MLYNEEQKQNYKYLFYQAVENENESLLNLVPEEYLPEIKTGFIDIDNYMKTGDIFNIKYINLKLKDKINYDNALIRSCNYNQINSVKFFIEKGANVSTNNNSPLKGASRNGCLEIVKYLVKKGADIHANDDISIISAVLGNDFNMVKYLVKNGADVNAYNGDPLMYAIVNKHYAIIKYLIQHGADIHAGNNKIIKKAKKSGLLNYIKVCDELNNSKFI